MKWWWPLYEFLIKVFTGTLMFVIIAIPTVGLNYLTKYLRSMEFSMVIVNGLDVVMYLLFAADIVLFIVFMVRSSYIAFRRMCDR